ncbi:MAG: radical SAM family heme chaperone HemW [Acidobacteria bacterium]|nr:radical SAM family heme chaperone HemW [Acidobacteriota bacterium]
MAAPATTADRAADELMPAGLYLHIPFCEAICHYCNFTRGVLDEAVKSAYVSALVTDISRAPERGAEVETIFLGGGTPSVLSPAELARILDACRGHFGVAHDAEVTLEANPESASLERLEGYRAAGVNRLSFGVQSLDDRELARLGRLHSAARARQAVDEARRAGFSNISLDLMLWLPEQRTDDWHRSVDAVIEVAPSHASMYLLEVYPNAPLREEMMRRQWSVAPDEEAADMYLEGLSRFEAAGYRHYEISNVARPGFESRHNRLYWTGGHWLGFGCGAHSTWHGRRWRVMPGTGDYIRAVSESRPVRLDIRDVPPTEQLEEALFMGLRLTEGVDLQAIRERWGVDVLARYGDDLAPFLEEGLVQVTTSGRLRLTRNGMLVANEIMVAFIGDAVQ